MRIGRLTFVIALVASYFIGFGASLFHYFPYDLLAGPFTSSAQAVGNPVHPRLDLFEASQADAQIVFVGDSITQGGLWNEYFPSYAVANRGIAGDTTANVLDRLDTIAATTPDTALVMIGVNDIFRGVAPEAAAANIHRLVGELQIMGADVVLQSTIECSRAVCGGDLDQVRILNELVSGLSFEREIQRLDPNDVLSGPEGLLSQFTYDGIHLNGKGYRAWVDIIGARALP